MYRGVRSWFSILPVDLWLMVFAVIVTIVAVFAPGVRESPARVVVGFVFVLFVPGYAFVAALFPEKGAVSSDGDADGIDGIERLVLSFGMSIAIVPVVGLVLNFTTWGIRLVPVLSSLSALTLGLVSIGAVRRQRLPPDERFSVPVGTWAVTARSELVEPGTRTDLTLNVVLILALLVAVVSVGYAVAGPERGEPFTEFYLLAENERGVLVADDYPTTFTVGERRSVVVGVGNHEGEPMEYTVVVDLHEVRFDDGSAVVVKREQLGRFAVRLEAGETAHHEHVVSPTLNGTRLRLTYLLYRGEPPGTPTVATAYRETHLWVNVTDS